MTVHGQTAAVLLSDLMDHADSKEPPCRECVGRAKQIADFFALFGEVLSG